MSDAERVRATLARAARLHDQAAAADPEPIVRAAGAIREAIAGGRRVLVFGNGGSAADAQHLAAELVGRFTRERRGWPVLALTADAAVLTSIANDYGLEAVFARQVDAHGGRGDIAVAITTSGESANVNAALVRARAIGLTTIGITGRGGGETGRLVEIHVHAPGTTSAEVQEVQRTILHALCALVEDALGADAAGAGRAERTNA